jgi:hypothetical protein
MIVRVDPSSIFGVSPKAVRPRVIKSQLSTSLVPSFTSNVDECFFKSMDSVRQDSPQEDLYDALDSEPNKLSSTDTPCPRKRRSTDAGIHVGRNRDPGWLDLNYHSQVKHIHISRCVIYELIAVHRLANLIDTNCLMQRRNYLKSTNLRLMIFAQSSRRRKHYFGAQRRKLIN